MASSSFQTTLFDYLRVIFHRWYWIVLLVSISLLTAFIWVNWYSPKVYSSQLTAMVWSRGVSDQRVRRMLDAAPLSKLINDIRDKLQVDRRLQVLVCNLRHAVKHDLDERRRSGSSGYSSGSLHEELVKFSTPQVFVYRAPGLLGMVASESKKISIEHLAANMDIQSLSIILGVIERQPGEYPIALNFDHDDNYIKALQKKFYPDAKDDPDVDDIHKAAVSELFGRLKKEVAKEGDGKFSPEAKQELLTEIHAIPLLLANRLYFVAGDYFTKPLNLRYWVSRLKSGLNVVPLRGNLMIFNYSSSLYPRSVPFARSENVIHHVVVQTAYRMMKGEFRNLETGLWTDVRSVLEQQQKDLVLNLDAVNKRLYDLDALRSMQVSMLSQVGDASGKLPPWWSDSFFGPPRHTTHLSHIDKLIDESQEIEEEIASIEAQQRVLKARIEGGPNVRVIPTERRIRKGDSAEIIALKKARQLKEFEIKKWLQKCTVKHPIVVRLYAEVEGIDAQLREERAALMEGDKPEEVVVETEDPRIREWKAEIQRNEQSLAGLRIRLETKSRFMKSEKQKAEEAIEKQREFESLREKQRRLTSKLHRIEGQVEEMSATDRVIEEFKVEFSVHTEARRPGHYSEPKENLVLVMALLLGVVASGATVFLIEYTDHSIKTIEDVKRHIGLPVLGTIPEFSFADVERHERAVWQGSLSTRSRSRGYIYPAPVDKEEPQPARNRAKVKARKRMQPLALIIAVALALSAVIVFATVDWRSYLEKGRAAIMGSEDKGKGNSGDSDATGGINR